MVLISKRLGVVVKYEGKFYDIIPVSSKQKSITSSDSVEMILTKFVHFYTEKNEHVC